MASDARERALRAAYACVARGGMAKTTMEDIAEESQMSRATLYRVFPGGRDEVMDAAVVWEVARFFGRVAAAIDPDEDDVAIVLEQGLGAAHRLLTHHDLLEAILRDEADQLLPPLATVMPMVQTALADWFRPRLESARLRPGVDPAQAADLIARMALSYLGSPAGRDLDDPAQVRRLVHEQLLAGVLQHPADRS